MTFTLFLTLWALAGALAAVGLLLCKHEENLDYIPRWYIIVIIIGAVLGVVTVCFCLFAVEERYSDKISDWLHKPLINLKRK